MHTPFTDVACASIRNRNLAGSIGSLSQCQLDLTRLQIPYNICFPSFLCSPTEGPAVHVPPPATVFASFVFILLYYQYITNMTNMQQNMNPPPPRFIFQKIYNMKKMQNLNSHYLPGRSAQAGSEKEKIFKIC